MAQKENHIAGSRYLPLLALRINDDIKKALNGGNRLNAL
jgi:hypothetical protein